MRPPSRACVRRQPLAPGLERRRDRLVRMSATSAPQAPQRVCPRCSSICRTADAHCPFCGRSYRRRSPVAAIAAMLAVAVATILAAIALMLTAFGDELDTELEEQVDVVQRDFDRDVTGLESRVERRIERLLDERLPATTGP